MKHSFFNYLLSPTFSIYSFNFKFSLKINIFEKYKDGKKGKMYADAKKKIIEISNYLVYVLYQKMLIIGVGL